MLCDCWPLASLEELRHALAQHVAVYETPPTEERQARLEGRADAQAQVTAVRMESPEDRTRSEQ